MIPLKLLSNTGQQTIPYKVNINFKKLPIPYTGINICMINKNGNALLKRITYIPGNNFIEYNFDANNIEEIDSILIASESDPIDIKTIEINVNKNDSYKFEYIKNGKEIDFLKSKISLSDMKPIYDEEYKNFKDSTIILTLEFTIIGSLITGYLTNLEKAYSFGLGGTIGLLYVLLLEFGIDNIGNIKLGFLTIGQMRLGIIGALSTFLMTKYHNNIIHDNTDILVYLLGFMMYRVAIIYSYIKK